MEIKGSLIAAGISDADPEFWKTMYYRYNRIHVPLEGRIVYHDGDEKRILNEGMAYLMVNSYAPNFKVFPGQRYYHMYIDFKTKPYLFNRKMLEIDLSEDPIFLYLVKVVQTLIQDNIRTNQYHTIELPRDPYYYHQIKRGLQMMLDHLQERYQLIGVEDPKVGSAIRFIELHYNEDINNSDIASELQVDNRRLMQLFAKYMGVSPYQYLTQYRIEHAITELRNGKNVSETSYACGYQNETSFRRAFKRIMGCSPTEFLKNVDQKSIESIV